jgi:lipoprotein-anchoring transpeptidase ErfK/SrfK
VHRRFSSLVVGLCALAVMATGCGGESGSASLKATPKTTTTTRPAPPTTTTPAYVSQIAAAKDGVTQIDVYDSPTAPTPKLQLPNPWLVDPNVPTSTVRQVFLVEAQRADGWVQVLLPVRPNGSSGWVHASDVTITPNIYKINISLSAHTIKVTRGDAVIYTGPVAVGATDPPLPDVGKPSPTPTGEYYLRVLIQAPDPTTVYGPYAYGLSSHSDALDTFGGGDGEIGIHGNNDASVLGTSITHGCVRMDNAAITMLTKQLPLGTPVSIVA